MRPITTEEIEYASRILFNGDSTKFYDDIENKTGERVDAIQCLESKPIVACPGSGKTTVLLAKLIILARRMPFDDGSAICVLTHTNVAIDLIKEKLGSEASRLFAYPNFFGTIQSFVDRFLAVQSVIEKYKKRPDRINLDNANQKLQYRFNCLQWNAPLKNKLFHLIFASESKLMINDVSRVLNVDTAKSKSIIANLKFKKILTGDKSPYHLKYETTKNEINISKILDGEEFGELLITFIIEIHKKAKVIAANKQEQFELLKYFSINWEHKKIIDGNKDFKIDTPSGSDYISIKENCFLEGLLSFQDAYDFGQYYLYKHLKINDAFQDRFRFVFIDEMQDTATHQLNIIDKLFKNSNKTIVQEFGDPNQAIFDYDGQSGEWKYDEKNCLHLTDSKRFGKSIATIINPLKIKFDDPVINGVNPKSVLPPHLIIFDETQPDYAKMVLDEFGKLIIENDLHHCKRSKYVAIGRVGKDKGVGNITLKTYLREFEKDSVKAKDLYPTLLEYFQKELPQKKFNYTDRIINSILHLLELHDFKNEVESRSILIFRKFTKTSLFDFLQKENEDLFFEFKTFISDCGLMIKNDDAWANTKVHKKIIEFVKEKLLPLKAIEYKVFEDFVKISDEISENNAKQARTNIYTYKDDAGNSIPIKINTIHGEKGETHTATLYLETFYNKKYDSERIKEQLEGTELNNQVKGEKIMATKLAFVAMSRPEKLLCFAASSSRISEEYYNEKMKPLGWKIRIVFEKNS